MKTRILAATLKTEDDLSRHVKFDGIKVGMLSEMKLLRNICAQLALVLLVSISGPVVNAHHSTAMYDKRETIRVDGVVKRFEYSNPHCWLIVDVTKDDGSVETWGFEASGPSGIRKWGVQRKSDLQPGAAVTVIAYPYKDGRPAGSWVQVIRKEDGKQFPPDLE